MRERYFGLSEELDRALLLAERNVVILFTERFVDGPLEQVDERYVLPVLFSVPVVEHFSFLVLGDAFGRSSLKHVLGHPLLRFRVDAPRIRAG